MGVIHIDLFTTLDGVAQAPGGPEEDTEGGFAFGGWQAPMADEVDRRAGASPASQRSTRCCSAGRPTTSSPASGRTESDAIAQVFNKVPKYVASRGNPRLDWTRLDAARTRHRASGAPGAGSSRGTCTSSAASTSCRRCSLSGSSIGSRCGSSRSCSGAARRSSPAAPCRPTSLSSSPPRTSPKGAVTLRYALADGIPGTGNMAEVVQGAT